MKLLKTIANLGYGSRKQVTQLFREGRITDAAGEVLYADDQVAHADVRLDGEPLDPPPGLALAARGKTAQSEEAIKQASQLLQKVEFRPMRITAATALARAAALNGRPADAYCWWPIATCPTKPRWLRVSNTSARWPRSRGSRWSRQ